MHVLRHSVAIVVSTFLSGVVVNAATLSEISEPAELPPARFSAKQYIDSNGCVFVRAGVGNTITWVPRVTRSRELVCGYQPSLQSSASSSKTQTSQAPKTVKKAPRPAAAPVVVAQIAPAPVALTPPFPRLPAGYEPVWDDDRLNPKRGIVTARGEATMRLIWTDTVPRKLVAENGQDVKLRQAHLRYNSANGGATRTTTGTKTAPKPLRVASADAGARHVQVAAYRDVEDAKLIARRFMEKGYPVVVRRTKQRGKSLNIVFLGPFASPSDIRTGLGAAHAAGFKNAALK